MPLYLVNGALSAAGLKSLKQRPASAVKAELAALAESVGGTLAECAFIGGGFRRFAIFDTPQGAPPAIIYALLSSGFLEAGAEIARLLPLTDIDQAAQANGTLKAP